MNLKSQGSHKRDTHKKDPSICGNSPGRPYEGAQAPLGRLRQRYLGSIAWAQDFNSQWGILNGDCPSSLSAQILVPESGGIKLGVHGMSLCHEAF